MKSCTFVKLLICVLAYYGRKKGEYNEKLKEHGSDFYFLLQYQTGKSCGGDEKVHKCGDPAEEMPDGAKLVGRWHNGASTSGVAIVDADSIEAAMRWTMKWNDLMDITLDPAVEDEVVGQMCVEKLTALGVM